jgi:hypothetical protein
MIRQRLDDLCVRLWNLSDAGVVKIVAETYGGRCDDAALREAEVELGVTLPSWFSDLYAEIDGCMIQWQCLADVGLVAGSPAEGRIQLLSLEQHKNGFSGGGWEGDIWLAEDNDKESLEFKRRLRPFDQNDPDDSGYACFELTDTALAEQVVSYSSDFGASTLGCTLSEYFELALQCAGFRGWHQLLRPKKHTYWEASQDASHRSALLELADAKVLPDLDRARWSDSS